MHGRATQAQFAGELGGRDALDNPAQEQHLLRRPQVPALEDGAGVERVGRCASFAAIDLQVTALGSPEQVGLRVVSAQRGQHRPLV